MCANAVFTKQNTQYANIKTSLEIKDNQGSTIKQSNTGQAEKQNFLEHFPVTKIMFTIHSKGLVHFDADTNLVTQTCLPAKGIVEVLLSLSFFILITKCTTKQQSFDNCKVLGHPDDNISTSVSDQASLRSF